MSSIFKSIFGGGHERAISSRTEANRYAKPKDFGVKIGGRSALTVSDDARQIGIKKSPATGAYRRVRNSYGAQRRRLGGMIRDLESNQNPFIQARVRPLETALEERIADQGMEFGRRGIFGSLAENEINKTRFLGEREIGDARALATDEALSSLFDAEAQLQGLNEADLGLAESMVRDEILRMGLSLEALELALGDQKLLSGTVTGSETTKQPLDILGGIGQILSVGSGYQDLQAGTAGRAAGRRY